ncbi:unnamed protein product, partial [Rotaria sp. Silwood2]
MKEILLTIDFKQHHINEYTTFCRQLLATNQSELQNVHKIEREYRDRVPIWWYTYPCFLYSMLNGSLRIMVVDLIIRMGFFIQDLRNNIAKFHGQQFIGSSSSSSFTVYRGQGLSKADFDQLVKAKGALLSFNNFVSTSENLQVSLRFILDPSISSIPYADVHDASHFKGEKEILLSMYSIFRIGSMKQIDGNNRLWQVDLTLTGDTDAELHVVTGHMREVIYSGAEEWDRLGTLLFQLGEFDKAQETGQGEYKDAIAYFQQSIEIQQKILQPTDVDFATTYSNIGP